MSAAPLPESGSALIFSKGERERVRHFEERANALVTMDDCEQPFSIR